MQIHIAWCPKFANGQNIRFRTISCHFFANYIIKYTFNKTEVPTVILRCWTGRKPNWFKSYLRRWEVFLQNRKTGNGNICVLCHNLWTNQIGFRHVQHLKMVVGNLVLWKMARNGRKLPFISSKFWASGFRYIICIFWGVVYCYEKCMSFSENKSYSLQISVIMQTTNIYVQGKQKKKVSFDIWVAKINWLEPKRWKIWKELRKITLCCL